MRAKLDRNASVNLPCPQCGEKTVKTVAEIETGPRIRCPKCGVQFQVNLQKLLEKLKAATENVDSLQSRFPK